MTISANEFDGFDFHPDEKIVSIVEHNGDIYLATTYRVLRRGLSCDWVEIFYVTKALGEKP